MSTLLHNIIRNYGEIPEKHPINAVIHFAGLKAVADSVANPIRYWETNVWGSLCLFKVMKDFDCKTIVFSSSATIYGKSDNEPLKESFVIKPSNPYGQTKAAVESMLEDIFISSKSSWRIANLRYFNPVGAHESGFIGEDPCNIPNNLFPLICRVAKGIYKKIEVYGGDWPTIDGTGVRDYIHVMDLADSHRFALNHLLDNKPQFLNLNIGTGIGTSVLEFIKAFQDVNNCNIPFEISDRRPGDLAHVIANNEKALTVLKWEAIRTLEDICRDGWNWQTKNPNGYLN